MSKNLGFIGMIGAYIRRFISNLSGRCQPFTKIDEEGSLIRLDNACQEAFEEIKEYLKHPPVLIAPVSGKLFVLYVRAMDHSLRALLAQNNDQNHEHAIYYLSRTMIGAKHRYKPNRERMLTLVFAVQKMRHYLMGATHSSHLQSQSFAITDDKSIFAEQQTSEMGHIALTI